MTTTLWTPTKASRERMDEFLKSQAYIGTTGKPLSELVVSEEDWDDEEVEMDLQAKGDPAWVVEGMTGTPYAVLAGEEVKALDTDPDPSPKPGARRLRRYWTRGAGAIKIVWGTPGDFNRCVAQLGKYVKDPKGLCAVYHHSALGAWPGKGH